MHECRFIPQRSLMYLFAAPNVVHLIGRMSDYSLGRRRWVMLLHVLMLTAGGLSTIPWISRPQKGTTYHMAVH